MISKLPKWVEYGTFFLALLAGITNSVGLLGFQHQSISHLSGTATLLGTQLLGFNETTWHLFFIIFSFILGSSLSSLIVGCTALKLGRRYNFALCIESVLLFAAMIILGEGSQWGHYFASAACGLQNGLVTTYSGAVVRTTHVTGVLTDLGIMLGMKLKGEPIHRRRLALYLFIAFGFVFGGVIGGYFYPFLGINTLAIPATLCALLAFSYSVYLYQHKDH
ncbi:YoaK family protein [Aliivibrio sp. EL58]|uniref:YoaK family protein n=1 Tax=Aliivibrio sp. EL58 TaxID=2107582 RepID=UPI000EFC2149|nr:YoaK family protein [Aliivibrio sp. EL58]